ncbi:MAG: NADH-quinone oxidoreductase subunit NuoE, partial [Candidatus Thermoplasmatota archaeon]|nr:NADH-quinone oxidoreductase subunit NuoE [Candidatus Thermoplasmatota archaeon]
NIALHLGISLSRVYGVATFYSQFRFHPLGKYVIRVCQGTACHVNGGANIVQAIKDTIGIEEGETTPDGSVTLERVACLGCCSLAPVIMINDTIYGNLTPQKVRHLIHSLQEGEPHD